MKYRKKPIEVEVFKIGIEDVPVWCRVENIPAHDNAWYVSLGGIDTLQTARRGEYLIKEGTELKIMDSDAFFKMYEAVE